jgi:hypothetical protein
MHTYLYLMVWYISVLNKFNTRLKHMGKDHTWEYPKCSCKDYNRVHLLYIRNTDTGTIKRMAWQGRACFSSIWSQADGPCTNICASTESRCSGEAMDPRLPRYSHGDSSRVPVPIPPSMPVLSSFSILITCAMLLSWRGRVTRWTMVGRLDLTCCLPRSGRVPESQMEFEKLRPCFKHGSFYVPVFFLWKWTDSCEISA